MIKTWFNFVCVCVFVNCEMNRFFYSVAGITVSLVIAILCSNHVVQNK